MIALEEYQAEDGSSPFAAWFDGLHSDAAVKVTTALARVEAGNLGNLKSVGGGVQEVKIDYGPGYRVYIGRDGDKLVILLAGGAKKRQQKDIEQAQRYWDTYKLRKRRSLH